MKEVMQRCYGSDAISWICRGKDCPVCKGRERVLTEKGEQIKEVLVYFGLVKEDA